MDVRTAWVPNTAEEKDQVRRQMDRLLETAHFKNSRRYPALFRFIVEETLEGRGQLLKERLLGVRVFNRPADYDTANDPIVRVTVAEIRKRIAQYYHEEAHEAEMRIELTPGRYEPEFHPGRARLVEADGFSEPHASLVSWPEVPELLPAESSAPSPVPSLTPSPTPSRNKFRLSPLAWLVVVSLLLMVVSLLLYLMVPTTAWRFTRPTALEQMWAPVLGPHRTVTICMANRATSHEVAAGAGILLSSAGATPTTDERSFEAPAHNTAPAPGDQKSPSFLDHETRGENVVFSDVLATLKISDWLASQNRDVRLRLNSATTLEDLRQGPVILVGGLDNEWTLRSLSHLPYRFAGTDQEQYWVVDTKAPGSRSWEVDLKTQYASVKRDYALIARIHDESTGQVQVIVAGIGMSGTAAAGEFLVDPNRLEELRGRVGAGFRDRDFEAVLGTDVVNGIPGSARILATAVW
jgi:hypothetical protein